MHANFHCVTSIFCYKIAGVAEVSLANQAIFLCNQDVRACTMGCKRGFRHIRCDSMGVAIQSQLNRLCSK